jgi:hypothetical protein
LLKPFAFFLLLLLAGCTGCWGDRDAIDTSDVQLEIDIYRLDTLLFHASRDSLHTASLRAHAELGDLYQIYIEDILQGAPIGDPQLSVMLSRFVNDPDWSAVQEAIDSVFADMEPQEEDFSNAFARLKVLFPDSTTPRIVAFNSGFNYGIYPTEDALMLGLEWFIGQQHPVIGHLAPDAFPQYVKDRMHPEMLVPSAVKGWLMVHYLKQTPGEDVLTHLVETGKVMVLLDALLPDTPPHLKFAFSQEQLKWTEANEFNLWKEIVNSDKLFSKKPIDVNRFLNDAPFTPGFPRESPGHIGEWIGYRMVRAYLDNDPNVTFEQLFQMNDPREILKHYKPK